MNNFKDILNKYDISYNDEQIKKLDTYYSFLKEYNLHTNLTRIDDNEIYIKHFLDSIMISKYIDLNSINNMIDIGTGAGFPGVVLKIFYPNINVTLLDSNNKKTKFLEELINKLDLKNVKVINMRAEDYLKNHYNEYDLCTSRSVAFIDIIVSLSLPFIKKTGSLVLMKGNYEDEKNILFKYKNELNIDKYDIFEYNLPDLFEKHLIIKITKKKEDKKCINYSDLLKKSSNRKVREGIEKKE